MSLNHNKIKLINHLYNKPDAKPSELVGEVKHRTLYDTLDSLYEEGIIRVDLQGKNKVYKLSEKGLLLGWIFSEPNEAFTYYRKYVAESRYHQKHRRHRRADKHELSSEQFVIISNANNLAQSADARVDRASPKFNDSPPSSKTYDRHKRGFVTLNDLARRLNEKYGLDINEVTATILETTKMKQSGDDKSARF